MKPIKIAGIFLALFCSVSAYAQVATVIPKKVSLIKNAIGTLSLFVDFEMEMGDEELDPDFWITAAERPSVSIQYADQKETDCQLTVNPALSPGSIGFTVTGFNQETLRRFLNGDKDNQIKLVIDTDIKVRLMARDGFPSPRYWLIKAEVANKMMNDGLTFSDADRADFLTYLNNFYYYENMVDFGIMPGKDSTSSEYILSMRFQNAYNRKDFLKCDPKKKGFPIYWSLDTRLSTNFSDSLNYIKFYPLNFLFEDFSKKIPYQFNVKLGHESSQDFANKRGILDASLNFIIPNLINLTTAQSNRLRLKPVITAGVKGYYDYSNGIESFASGQAHIDGHYYIPVFNNYAIIIDGGVFYDVSNERNPDKKVLGNYSITLGAEIPKTGFKAMFKYVDGKTDINFRQGSIISIGLLMDFFQEQRKTN
ncbi:MAG: hypothetical protein ABW007_18800 [Chitinophagaceae bacterium]